MPGKGGEEVCAHIREQHPYLPIVIASGYNVDDVSLRFAPRDSTVFLQKPYGRDELSTAVAEAVSSSLLMA